MPHMAKIELHLRVNLDCETANKTDCSVTGMPCPIVEDSVIFSIYSFALLPFSLAGLASRIALANDPKFW